MNKFRLEEFVPLSIYGQFFVVGKALGIEHGDSETARRRNALDKTKIIIKLVLWGVCENFTSFA